MDTKAFEAGAARVSAQSVTMGRSVRRQGQAFTQLAYALDDVQYGFRGVQNNLQAIAVSAGLSGPVVLGITAVTIALGAWINKLSETEGNIFNLRGEVEKLRGDLSSLTGSLVEEDLLETKIEKKWDAIISKQLKYVGILEGIIASAGQYGGIIRSVADFFGKGTSDTLGQVGKDTDQKKKDIALAKDKRQTRERMEANRKYYKDQQLHIQRSIELLAAEGAAKKDLYQQEVELIAKIDFSKLTKEEQEAFQHRIDVLTRLMNQLNEVVVTGSKGTTDEITAAGSAAQSAAAAAFSGLGTAIGEALAGDGNFGDKFLKILGKFMVQFGSALIALGIAESAWLASFDPGTKIAAGIALVVAGAAISSAYSKKPGGGKSGSAGAGTPTISVTPNRIQGFTDGSLGLVGTLEGENIRVALARTNNSYNAKN